MDFTNMSLEEITKELRATSFILPGSKSSGSKLLFSLKMGKEKLPNKCVEFFDMDKSLKKEKNIILVIRLNNEKDVNKFKNNLEKNGISTMRKSYLATDFDCKIFSSGESTDERYAILKQK